eukprot:GHVO01029297.1.p2 GENE.GHVO01029297.1~~GHVO01029297.1.p2  ORF type:complete len:243 (+),score=57.36 GHVO01029297.1:1261-1989(+)
MQAAILNRRVSPDPSVDKELVLDGCKIPAITPDDAALLQKFTSLEMLALNAVNLSSFQNFPPIPSLVSLELQDNHLDDSSNFSVLAQMPLLEAVRLGGNRIRSLESLAVLKSLPKLRELDLLLNPLCDIIRKEMTGSDAVFDDESVNGQFHRKVVFELFPNLERVDGFDRSGREVEDDEDDDESEDDDDRVSLTDFYAKDYDEDDDEEEMKGEEYQPVAGDDDDDDIELDDDDASMKDAGEA